MDIFKRSDARIGLTPSASHELRTMMAAPGRYYHGNAHVAYMLHLFESVILREVSSVDSGVALSNGDLLTIERAVRTHDCILDAGAGDNEERSAQAAVELMTLTGREVEDVTSAVMATKTHVAKDGAEQVLIDLDLAILASSPIRYGRYASDIRREYHYVPEATYRPARAAVMRKFLDDDMLLSTLSCLSTGHATTLRDRARRNIIEEIRSLGV